MQVLVLAVQNCAPPKDIGVATTTATFFRSMGGSLGVALFGAIFASRLADELATLPPRVAARFGGGGVNISPAQVHALPPEIRDDFLDAFVERPLPHLPGRLGPHPGRLRALLRAQGGPAARRQPPAAERRRRGGGGGRDRRRGAGRRELTASRPQADTAVARFRLETPGRIRSATRASACASSSSESPSRSVPKASTARGGHQRQGAAPRPRGPARSRADRPCGSPASARRAGRSATRPTRAAHPRATGPAAPVVITPAAPAAAATRTTRRGCRDGAAPPAGSPVPGLASATIPSGSGCRGVARARRPAPAAPRRERLDAPPPSRPAPRPAPAAPTTRPAPRRSAVHTPSNSAPKRTACLTA